MSGQGSPIPHQLTLVCAAQSLRIAMFCLACVLVGPSECAAQSSPTAAGQSVAGQSAAGQSAAGQSAIGNESNDLSVDALRQHYRQLQDAATTPFQLHFPSETFPVDPVGHPGKLTVQVVGLRKYAGQTLTLMYRLYRVEDGEQIQREQTDIKLSDLGSSEVIELDDDAPAAAGVYEIRCRLLEPTEKLWSKIRGDKSEIASIQTPWMIHAGSEQTAEKTLAEKTLAEKTLAEKPTLGSRRTPLTWTQIGNASVFDQRSWDSPWSFSPWPGSSKDQKPEDNKANSVVWQLPQHAPHQLCRITVNVRQVRPPAPSSPGVAVATNHSAAGPIGSDAQVEFSSTPEFSHVSRSESLSSAVELNLSTSESVETYRFQTLHYPAVAREFVRVTGISSDQGYEISSIELEDVVDLSQQGQGAAEDGAFSDAPLNLKRVSVEVRSMEWAEDVTTDFAKIFPDRKFSASTLRLFRVWKASQRMGDYARWLGFDELIVPFDSDGQALASHPSMVVESRKSGPLDSSKRFADAHTLLALSRWLDQSDLRLSARIRGDFNLMQDVTRPAESEVYPALDQIVERQLQRCLADWSGYSRRAGGTARFAFDAKRTAADALENPAKQPGSETQAAWSVLPDTRYDFLNSISKHSVKEIAVQLDSTSQLLSRRCLSILDESRRMPSERLPLVVHRLKSEKPTESSVDYLSVFTDASGVTLINFAPWTTEVTLKFSRPISGNTPEVQWNLRRSDADTSAIRLGVRTNECIVELKPLEVIGLDVFYRDVDPNPASLMTYHATVVGGSLAIQAIKSRVGEVIGKIGNLAQPDDYMALLNGGFESQGQVGIVGWMHTQFPSDAVALDPTEAIEGSQSICMTTSEKSMGRTWLVSAPFPVPVSGRLAVSLATRSSLPKAIGKGPAGTSSSKRKNPFAQVSRVEASDGKTKKTSIQRVRVSLEGSQFGEPVRYVSEFEVPRDGRWTERRIVLETDQLDASSIQEVRLTIDSLSPGKLWIDDVHLHDQFATQAERAGMQGQAFLAIQGLQRDQLHPAARLLQNRWSTHLMNESTKTWPSSYRAVHQNMTAGPNMGGRLDPATNSRSGAARRAAETQAISGRENSNKNAAAAVTPPRGGVLGRNTDRNSESAGNPEELMEPNSTAIDRSADSAVPRPSEATKSTGRSTVRDKLSKPRPSMAERLKSWLPRPLRF